MRQEEKAENLSNRLNRKLHKTWKDLSCTVTGGDSELSQDEYDYRGQSPDGVINPLQEEWEKALREALQIDSESSPPLKLPVRITTENYSSAEVVVTPEVEQASFEYAPAPAVVDPLEMITQPYMSYTRVFDGSDAKFTAALRNYLELSGDQRSGGWTGYLHRSEDFIRFCMHRTIIEMMQLHGGESRKQWVFMERKFR